MCDRLPPERDIAERFSVSRSVVREALIMLELEKLIEVRKGSGVYVIQIPTKDKNRNADSGYGPFELMQATKTDILKMKQAIDQERQALDNGSVDESADELFHCLLANMVYEVWQARKHSSMWHGLHSHTVDFSYQRQWLDDYQRILRAVTRRDAKQARQEMWQHLENVKHKLLEISDVDDPAFDGYLFESVPAAENVIGASCKSFPCSCKLTRVASVRCLRPMPRTTRDVTALIPPLSRLSHSATGTLW